MTDRKSRNPFALPGAEEPRTGHFDINGCRVYAEVRGHGPAILIIGACSDDAEMFRPEDFVRGQTSKASTRAVPS